MPFVCGAKDLGEALRRISEGAAMIRTKGEAGTGNVIEAVRHTRAVQGAIKRISVMDESELYAYAKEISAPFHLLKEVARTKRLPVVNFAVSIGAVVLLCIVGPYVVFPNRPVALLRQQMQLCAWSLAGMSDKPLFALTTNSSFGLYSDGVCVICHTFACSALIDSFCV